jgi:hypothetical protein
VNAIEYGGAVVLREAGSVRLVRPATPRGRYSDAEISDPRGYPAWRPPLTLTLRARFSHPVGELRGTAGFGFWNEGISPAVRLPRPPQALWFFAAGPDFNVPLALGVPGRGFKAGTIDARRLAFFALLPAAPLGILLMRVPALYRRLWPIAQRAIGVSEASLNQVDLTRFHDFALRWETDRARFLVDGREVLRALRPPANPLRFVAWIDNAYAVATPQGQFALGTVDAPSTQWLEIENLRLDE